MPNWEKVSTTCSVSFWRIIPIDGRKHRDDVEESYLGDSVGHWDGDKLVEHWTVSSQTQRTADEWHLLSHGFVRAAGLADDLSPGDLIVATHGRGFYIMDNLSALRQMSDAIVNGDGVQVFAPKARSLDQIRGLA